MNSHQHASWSVGVIVPAHNERSTIEKCIETIKASLEQSRVRDAWIVVVADDCSDNTATLAHRSVGARGEVLEVNVRSAGAARRAGAARVLHHFRSADSSRLWLANTDADTYVTSNWISVQLSLADTGVTGVAGIVRLEAGGTETAQEEFLEAYAISSAGTHSHVHGANLSMRADAYVDVGGWSTLALAEDHCLWGRLRHRGWRVSSPIDSVVITSARLTGRASGGFADTLRAIVEARHADA